MRYLQRIITWIDSLKSGRQFKQWATILLKILAVVISVGISVWSLVICVDTIGASSDSGLTSRILVIVGSILEVCIVITVAIVLAMLFWNRSNKRSWWMRHLLQIVNISLAKVREPEVD